MHQCPLQRDELDVSLRKRYSSYKFEKMKGRGPGSAIIVMNYLLPMLMITLVFPFGENISGRSL